MVELSDMHMRILEKEIIDCADVEELFGDYVDNELPSTLRARVATHIKHCQHCQEGEKGYRLVIALASELPRFPVPTDVKNRLRKSLNEKLGIELPMVSDS
jgi:hypothetical protein